MTVQPAIQMWSRHDAQITSDKGQRYKAVIRRGYHVLCDVGDTLREVANAPDLPALDDLYPDSLQIRVVARNPTQVSPIFYTWEIVYEGNFGPGGVEDSPIAQRPKVKWGKVDTEEEVDQDRDGKPLVTANNEAYRGLTKQLSDLTLTVTRNFESINLPQTYAYLHSVNSDVFPANQPTGGFAPGVCRMTQFDAEEAYDKSRGGYYVVTAGFTFRWPYNTTAERAWWKRVLHEGYMVKTRPPTQIVQRAKDETGQDTAQPVLLTSEGYEETNPDNSVWKEFPIYTPLPYNALGLFD